MSKLRRRSVVGAGVLGGIAASLGAPLVKRVEAADPRTLTVASTTDVDTLDPASFRTDGAYTVTTNVYDTSVGWEVAPSATVPGVSTAVPSKFIPNLAESFATEDDGATIVLKIRRDAKFPSGRPITAHSIKYMLDRGLQSPGYVRLTISALPARDVTGQLHRTRRLHLRDEDAGTDAARLPHPRALHPVGRRRGDRQGQRHAIRSLGDGLVPPQHDGRRRLHADQERARRRPRDGIQSGLLASQAVLPARQ